MVAMRCLGRHRMIARPGRQKVLAETEWWELTKHVAPAHRPQSLVLRLHSL